MKTKTSSRREAILVTAQAVFEEMGFEQASMTTIAERLGSSKATLYRYFDSKEALFTELVRRFASLQGAELMAMLCGPRKIDPGHALPVEAMQAFSLLDPAADVGPTLKAFAFQVLKHFHTPACYATWRMVIGASNNPEIGRLFYETGPKAGMLFVQQYMQQLIATGKLRPCDPHIAVCHFRGLIESEVSEEGLYNVLLPLDDAAMEGMVSRAIDAFMCIYGPKD